IVIAFLFISIMMPNDFMGFGHGTLYRAIIQSNLHRLTTRLDDYHAQHGEYPEKLTPEFFVATPGPATDYRSQGISNLWGVDCGELRDGARTWLQSLKTFCLRCNAKRAGEARELAEVGAPKELLDDLAKWPPDHPMDVTPFYPFIHKLPADARSNLFTENVLYFPADTDGDGRMDRYEIGVFGLPLDKGKDFLLPDGSPGTDGVPDGILAWLDSRGEIKPES
ncbi:MAG: hypothetical protein ACREJQ_05525, partial [bacterium]